MFLGRSVLDWISVAMMLGIVIWLVFSNQYLLAIPGAFILGLITGITQPHARDL